MSNQSNSAPKAAGLYNTDFYAAIRKNKRNSILLVIALCCIMVTLGYLIGWYIELQMPHPPAIKNYGGYYVYDNYQQADKTLLIFNLSRFGLTGALIALIIAIVWSSIALFSGNKVILFAAGAVKVSHSQFPVLHNVVNEMSIAAGIPPPEIYLIETDALNAFATGLNVNNAAVAITRGLLESLNRDELQGVIAHEIGHIINLDIRFQTVVSIIVGMVVLLSDYATRVVFYSSLGGKRSNNSSSNSSGGAGLLGLVIILFSILAPIAAILLQLAVSRQREYLADATSVKLTRNPLGLISALRKLGKYSAPFHGANRATQNLFIVNPFRNVAKRKSALLSTHPPLEDRIRRLENMDE